MILDAGLLRGWPKERAELYGKPHLGARYTHDTAYEPTQARCAVCGRRACNCHHVARRSWGKTFRLVTPNGVWELHSPLFALCGSGTTGCHGKFHDGGLHAEWVWRTWAAEEAWWSGSLLREFPPHSPDLYEFGYWAITDRYGNEIIREVK